MTYSIGQDGTLNKNGQMCYCIHTENGSCTTQCAAFEERAKGRAFLHCIGREIIAPTDIASLSKSSPPGVIWAYSPDVAPIPNKVPIGSNPA